MGRYDLPAHTDGVWLLHEAPSAHYGGTSKHADSILPVSIIHFFSRTQSLRRLFVHFSPNHQKAVGIFRKLPVRCRNLGSIHLAT